MSCTISIRCLINRHCLLPTTHLAVAINCVAIRRHGDAAEILHAHTREAIWRAVDGSPGRVPHSKLLLSPHNLAPAVVFDSVAVKGRWIYDLQY